MVEVTKLPSLKDGYFVKVSKKEALLIIKSLASQLASGNPNSGREELGTGEDNFSIGVEDEEK